MANEWKNKYIVHAIDDCDENTGGYFCMIHYIEDDGDYSDYFDYFCIHKEEIEDEMAKGFTKDEAVENLINAEMEGYNAIPEWINKGETKNETDN